MGVQVKPTRTLRSWMTMPNRPQILAAAGSEALVTVLQHWIGPVSQEGAAMAAAARARVVRCLNCMLRIVRMLEVFVSLRFLSLAMAFLYFSGEPVSHR